MTHIGLFEGIGGFSLAARWMGWKTKAWCEWNEFNQKVLRYHFPEAEGFSDITKSDFTKYANTIDVLTGGFPCQPFSLNGKRKGKEDERYLFPEMLRAIREVQPCWVVGENVPGLINWNRGMVFNEVQADLETIGFEVFPPVVLPACGIGAIHQRDRVWIVAYSESNRNSKRQEPLRRTQSSKWANILYEFSERFAITDKEYFKTAIRIGDDGLSRRLDTTAISENKWRTESLKSAGNAIVPQMALQIFRVIETMEQDRIKGALETSSGIA